MFMVAPWKIITGTATAVLGVAVLVAAGLGELYGDIGQPATTNELGGPTRTTLSYSGVGRDNVVVAAGEIDVDGGTVPLAPLATGMIVEVPVQEGVDVKAGQPLVRLDARMAELQVEQAESALAEAGVRLEQAKQSAQTHKHKVEQLRQSVVAANARLQAAQRQVNKLETLRTNDTVPEETFLNAKDQIVELEAMVNVAREELGQAELIDPALLVRAAEVGERAAEAKLAAARELLSNHTLTAPCDGRILRMQVGVGQILAANDPRFSIWFCPDKPQVVRCEVDQEFADRIKDGMKVVVVNETFDGRQWRGHVRRCATWVAPRRSLWNKVFEVSDVPTVECIVDLDRGQQDLRIGQRVRVSFESSMETDDEPLTETAGNAP